MSYSAIISFKKIDAEDIQEFFSAIKKTIVANFEAIAKDECCYMPLVKFHSIDLAGMDYSDVEIKYPEVGRENSSWVEHIFSYRWFYDKEWKLLGVYGVPEPVKSMFDTTVCFQNSSDQDYRRTEWEGSEEFLRVYDKWQNSSVDTIRTALGDMYSEDEPFDSGYEKRTLAYKEIWKRYSDSLYDDQSAVYFACFSYYDCLEKSRFLRECYKQAKHFVG